MAGSVSDNLLSELRPELCFRTAVDLVDLTNIKCKRKNDIFVCEELYALRQRRAVSKVRR